MRDTVRRSPRGVEQAGASLLPAPRAAGIARSGAAPGAAPGRLALATTRIPHKVPERDTDSMP
ncbi:hypothetical protein GCM10010358_16670 [Streptomyces minutiscleroticus]|uniref:Uncharacterized protein n=1 Tax=Streptomyces minutiscleroticus TaxID=68238 RepID=A0A918NDS8_9ACTN|nr:hypothetical protein GCM10010358_16670 [Streptomyces minutiscleroticus]